MGLLFTNKKSTIDILELTKYSHVDKTILREQFRILSKKYDPDYSGDKYRDDRMLIKLNRA